jgi:RimJ/RimL family protein N-acetyltransferase
MQFAGPAYSFPLTADQLDESLSDVNRYVFEVVDAATNAPIGHAEIYVNETSACLGRLLIGDEAQRGKGIGLQMVNMLLDYAFHELEQTAADLNVFTWNIAAIRCYEKAGFVVNPNKYTERMINGQTWIGMNMVISRRRWLDLQGWVTGRV